MKKYNTEFTLLVEKLNYYKEIEEITSQMSILDVDDILISLKKRETLLNKSAKVDKTLSELLEKNSFLKDVINSNCRRQDLDDELRSIFDLSFSIKAIINRLQKNENLLRDHLELQKKQVLAKIEKLNKSPDTVAVKYNTGVQTLHNNPTSIKKNRFI